MTDTNTMGHWRMKWRCRKCRNWNSSADSKCLICGTIPDFAPKAKERP